MNDSEIKYFHISPDDKFLDYVIENSEAVAPGKNIYVVRSRCGKLKYVKNSQIEIALNVEEIQEIYYKFKRTIEHIIVHFLGGDSIKFLLELEDDKVKVSWVFWGADGYALPKLVEYKYQSKTQALVSRLSKELLFVSKGKQFAKRYLGYRGTSSGLIKAIKRVDRCATWVQQDYELVRPYNPQMEFVYYNNNSLEQLVQAQNVKEKSSVTSNQYVVLGNSGTPTNNHLEVIDVLAKSFEYDVVVPLSYGNKDYLQAILKLGKQKLGSRFIPLTKFISKEEYNSIINGAEFIVMNHLRQQAANSILTALWLGTPVFMNPKSPLYKNFVSWGITINKIDDISKGNKSFKTQSCIEDNREILKNWLSNERINEGFKALLEV